MNPLHPVFRGIVYIDGKLFADLRLAFQQGTTGDAVTSFLVALTEEKIDRRILGDVHQMPGQSVSIGVRQLS